MFTPKTSRIAAIQRLYPASITSLDPHFGAENISYVDWGNVRNWSNRLGWHVCHKRLHQFATGFSGPTKLKFYFGTDPSLPGSQELNEEVRRLGYEVHTKPVKHIRLPIDVSSISAESPDIVKNFVFPALLKTLSVDMVRTLNEHLRGLNRAGVYAFEDLKCNFDVEIGRDMLLDSLLSPQVETYSIWSGDSDFADPIASLLADGKRVVVFGVSGMIARELNQLRDNGLTIFDVKKIKEYICWARELPSDIKRL